MPIENVKMGKNVQYHDEKLLNLYGCIIGRGCRIGAFTEIGPCEIGKSCNIGAHCFIPEGVIIESYVFIGPRVTFVNDKVFTIKGALAGRTQNYGRQRFFYRRRFGNFTRSRNRNEMR